MMPQQAVIVNRGEAAVNDRIFVGSLDEADRNAPSSVAETPGPTGVEIRCFGTDYRRKLREDDLHPGSLLLHLNLDSKPLKS